MVCPQCAPDTGVLRDLMLQVWRWHHIVRDKSKPSVPEARSSSKRVWSWVLLLVEEGGKKRREQAGGRRGKIITHKGPSQDHLIYLPDWQKRDAAPQRGTVTFLSSFDRRTRSQESLLGFSIAKCSWILACGLPVDIKLHKQSKLPVRPHVLPLVMMVVGKRHGTNKENKSMVDWY